MRRNGFWLTFGALLLISASVFFTLEWIQQRRFDHRVSRMNEAILAFKKRTRITISGDKALILDETGVSPKARWIMMGGPEVTEETGQAHSWMLEAECLRQEESRMPRVLGYCRIDLTQRRTVLLGSPKMHVLSTLPSPLMELLQISFQEHDLRWAPEPWPR